MGTAWRNGSRARSAVSGRSSAGSGSTSRNRRPKAPLNARFAALPRICAADSESLDPDDVGDIADEGAGHRG